MSDRDLSDLDPHARRFLAMVAIGAGGGRVTVEERRRSFEALMRFSGRPDGSVTTHQLSLRACGGEVPLRIYTPMSTKTVMPGVIYFHGGGLVAGSLDTHDALCRSLAHQAEWHILAVGYRLAPEHPFPTAVLDAIVAVRWITKHTGGLGLERDALAIGGDSGGATLAAVVCQILRHRGLFKAQVLLCPVLDATGRHASRTAFGSGFLLDADTMASDLMHYAPRRMLDDPRLSPLHASALSGVPPAIVHTAGFDPLRDEGAAYVARLAAAGIPVEHTRHDRLIHHFYGLTGVIPSAGVALAAIAADIRSALA